MINLHNNKNFKQQTAYIIVHPDNYAINMSKIIKSADQYKINLIKKIQHLLNNNTLVIVLNLEKNCYNLPDFLKKYQEKVFLIPSLNGDTISTQSDKLKKFLYNIKSIKNIIFTGGWKNACLKHTISKTIVWPSKIQTIDCIDQPIKVKINLESKNKYVLFKLDHEFIF